MNRPAKSGSISRSLSAKIISASPVLIRLQRRLTNELKVSPRSKNRAVDDESGLKGLLRLPYDVLVVVYTFLDARDITRLSQVCRALHSISSEPLVWTGRITQLLQKPAVLVFDEITDTSHVMSSSIASDPTNFQLLGRALVRSEQLRKVWGSTSKELIGISVPPVSHEDDKLASPLLNAHLQIFAADTFLPVPDRDDLFDDLCLLSPGDFDDPVRCAKIAFFPQYRPGTHFMTLHQGMMLPFGHRVPHRETCFSFHLAPCSLRSNLPDRTCLKLRVKRYHFPEEWTVIEHLIDTKYKRNYALVLRPEKRKLDIVVVLDPKTGLTAAFTTSLTYSAATTAAGFRLAFDGTYFDVFADASGTWTHHTFMLAQLTSVAKPFASAITSLLDTFSPTHTTSASMPIWPTLLSGEHSTPTISLLRHWAIPAPVQLSTSRKQEAGVFSHILLFRDRSKDSYSVVQYFSSSRLPSTPDRTSIEEDSINIGACDVAGPQAPGICFSLPLIERRIVNEYQHMLTLAVSFSHMAWVECTSERVRFPRPHLQTRNVLKIVQFADIRLEGEGETAMCLDRVEKACVRELDVPSRILENSFVIYLEPALASVFVLTNDSVLHKFRFA